MNFGLVPDDSPLNYDEWRALLGLPDAPANVKVRAQFRSLGQVAAAWQLAIVENFVQNIAPAIKQANEQFGIDTTFTHRRWPRDPDIRTPEQRALPRPASAPPMWANNPTKTRRTR